MMTIKWKWNKKRNKNSNSNGKYKQENHSRNCRFEFWMRLWTHSHSQFMSPLFLSRGFSSVFFWLDAYDCIIASHQMIYRMIRNICRREKRSAKITKFSSMHIAQCSMFAVHRLNSGVDVLRCVIQTGTVTHLMANYECGFILFIETVKWWIRNSFYTFSILFFLLFCISLITTIWRRDLFSSPFYWNLRTE